MDEDIFDFNFNVGDLANFIYVANNDTEGKICVRIVKVSYDKTVNENTYYIAAPKNDLDRAGCGFFKDVNTSFLKAKYNIGPDWDIAIAAADELIPPEIGFIKII